MIPLNRIKYSTKAFGIHISISVVMAFFLWVLIEKFLYPYPYSHLLGGSKLFLLLVCADVICGPILTAIVVNPKKSRKEIWFDIFIVVLIQVGALAYGVHSAYLARPIAVVYEVDRFVAISEAQLKDSKINLVSKEFQEFRLNGPIFVGVRKPINKEEKNENMTLSISGVEPSARPSWWQSYELSRSEVISRMHPVNELIEILPENQLMKLKKDISKLGVSAPKLYYLPLVSFLKLDDYIVILDENANVVGYSAVNGWL